jgi:hypothetical protein
MLRQLPQALALLTTHSSKEYFMALPVQTIVGGVAPATAGSLPQSLRVGATGELIAAELHGCYYEPCVRKTMFSGSNIAAVATSAGFSLADTGFCLTNPIGSTVNLVLNKIKYAPLAAQSAALQLGLMTGYSASSAVSQTTPLVALSNFVGQPAGQGLIAAAVTMPVAPTRVILLDSLLTGAITVSPTGGCNVLDMQGSLIVPPGGYVAFYTSAASAAASLSFGMTWEEVSIVI